MTILFNGLRAIAIPVSLTTAALFSSTAVTAQEVAEETEYRSTDAVITVTARKREESLLEVPIAISAMSAREIEDRGIVSITDIIDNTAGISVASSDSNRNDRSFQQVSLRAFTPSTTSSTLTASFINGVPVASATALNAVIDPERVEILRGPQNAYFGRNAFAGAINIVTKQPSDTFGGSFSAQWSERNGYDVSAALEGPLIRDFAAFRITARAWSLDGGYRNNAIPQQTLGDQSTRAVTAQLSLAPAPGLKIKLFGMYSKDEDGSSAEGMISAWELRAARNGSLTRPYANLSPNAIVANNPYLTGDTGVGTLVVPGKSNCTLNGLVDGANPNSARRPRPFICGAIPSLSNINIGSNTPNDKLTAQLLGPETDPFRAVSSAEGVSGYGLVREYRHFHAALDYDFDGSDFVLSGLFGYNKEAYSELDDLDQYDSSPFVNGTARGYWSFPFMVERVNEDFSGEVRASYGNAGPLQAMLGASYLRAKMSSDLVSIFGREQLGGAPNPTWLSAPGRAETTGVFGSLTYDFTSALTLSLEGRFQRDKIFAIAGGPGVTLAAGNQLGAPAGFYAYGETYHTKTYNSFLPRAILSYDVAPGVMIYASYARASNASITSFNTQFIGRQKEVLDAAAQLGLETVLDPETLDNFEAGIKAQLFDGRLQATLGVYRALWKDQYNLRTLIIQLQRNGGTDVEALFGVANAGNTRLTGVEFDVTAIPVDGLTFSLSGAMNDSNIRSFSDPAISTATGLYGDDFRGNQNPRTSKWSFNTSLAYTGKLSEHFGFFVRGDLNWKSRVFVDAANLTWIGDRTTVNARVGFTHGDYRLEVFASNLLNSKAYTAIAQSALLDPQYSMQTYGGFGQIYVGLPDPRTLGIRTSYKF